MASAARKANIMRRIRETPAPIAEPEPTPVEIVPPPDTFFSAADPKLFRPGHITRIQRAACRHFSISLASLKSPSRVASLAYPRMIAIHAARKYTKWSLPEIGRRFGRRDHTTALYAYRKIESLQDDPQVAADCEAIARAIGEVA